MKTETTYTCEHCGKRFLDKSECAAHEKQHKSIVPKFNVGDIVFPFGYTCPLQVIANDEILKNKNDVKYTCIPLDTLLGRGKESCRHVNESEIRRAYRSMNLKNSVSRALEIAYRIGTQDNMQKSIDIDCDGYVILRVAISTEPIFDIYNKDNQ